VVRRAKAKLWGKWIQDTRDLLVLSKKMKALEEKENKSRRSSKEPGEVLKAKEKVLIGESGGMNEVETIPATGGTKKAFKRGWL